MVDAVLEATVKLDQLLKSKQDTFLELDTLEAFQVAFLEDSSRAVQEDLDLKLWRDIIYPKIDTFRKSIASSKNLEAKKMISEELDTAILANLGYFDYILDRLKGLNAGGEVKRIRLRFTLYCGDLLRYRCSNNGTFQVYDAFSSSRELYFSAIEIDPEDGTAFNQLAVVESLKESSSKSILKILFYYARAAVSKKPFSTAKDNIIKLSRKTEYLETPLMRLVRRLSDGRPVAEAYNQASLSITIPEDKFYFLALIKAICIAFKSKCDLDVSELAEADERLLKLLIGSEIIDESLLDRRHELLQLPLSQANEFEASQSN